MTVLQSAMSGSCVLLMACAGIEGDVVGVSNVFFIAGAIVGVGAIVSFVGHRRRAAVTPARESEKLHTLPAGALSTMDSD